MADKNSNINVICFESDAFKALVSEVTNQMREELLGGLNPWISEKEAMDLLHISSKTTLLKYREEGNIDYRKPSSKQIIYRRQSVLDFIENSPKQ